MSIGSFFKSLSPVAKAGASDVEKAIADIQAKAEAEIAKIKADFAVKAAAATLAAKQADWNKFKADYEAYLKAGGAPANPPTAVAAQGPTGSTA